MKEHGEGEEREKWDFASLKKYLPAPNAQYRFSALFVPFCLDFEYLYPPYK